MRITYLLVAFAMLVQAAATWCAAREDALTAEKERAHARGHVTDGRS